MNRYNFDSERHIHTYDGKPLYGTSTISGVFPKVLTWWASGKALELMGWTPTQSDKKSRLSAAKIHHNLIKAMTDKQYLSHLDKCYRNHKDSLEQSKIDGVDLHAELERFIKDVMRSYATNEDIYPDNYDKRILPFIEWSDKNVQRFLWSEGHCYSEKLWVGGICDFGAELMDGTIALGDFKSSKEAYLNHFVQCAGYAWQIEENGWLNARGELLGTLSRPIEKLIIVPFGADEVKPIENKIGIGDLKIGFQYAIGIHRLLQMDKEPKF